MLPSNALAMAQLAAIAVMLLSIVLTIAVPFFPGAAFVAIAVLGAGGFRAYLVQDPAAIPVAVDVAVLCFCALGLTSSWFTEKLGFRFTYASPQIVWGGFLGMCFLAILRMPTFMQIIGLFLGAMAAAIGVERRGLKEAVARGPIGIYSLLGPRGFQLLMMVLALDIVFRFGF